MTEAHLAMPGTQLGDPVKAAAAIIEVAAYGKAPLHQLLGSDSYGLAKARIDALTADVERPRGGVHDGHPAAQLRALHSSWRLPGLVSLSRPGLPPFSR